jgi:hypothetical protein
MNSNNFEQLDFKNLESKSRFASLFPKDIKFLIKAVENFSVGSDTDPISGFSDSVMMKERVLLKLEAYLELFGGKDPEMIDPEFIKHHMPDEFKQKYFEQIQNLHQKHTKKFPARY